MYDQLMHCNQAQRWMKMTLGTVKENEYHAARYSVRRYDCFDHLPKVKMTQMIYHLKALIQGFQNLKRNWVWHHPGGATAQLTKKAPPLLNLV